MATTNIALATTKHAMTTGVEVDLVDMKLEVVVLGVSDVDRAKAFYQNLGWRLDADFTAGDLFRVVQLTPHNSQASILFGKGVTSAKPGSAGSLVLAVDDITAAHDDLIARGVDVSEIFHYAAGPFNNAVENPRVGGRDPQGRSYSSFASFEDSARGTRARRTEQRRLRRDGLRSPGAVLRRVADIGRPCDGHSR